MDGEHLADCDPQLSQASSSSVNSSLPSPIVAKFGDILHSEKIRILNEIIPQLDSLEGVMKENLYKLTKLLGYYCHSEVKSEANFYRLKRSREDVPFPPTEILEKQHGIEILHLFFEAVTHKSGRVEGENREKVAPIQATYYESFLKGTNLNCIGPYNYLKNMKIMNSVQTKQVLSGSLGGSYNFHNQQSVSEPLPITQIGPLVSDNAQRGRGKYQKHSYGKLDQSAPVSVCTHHIRLESITDCDDNSIFKNPELAPSNHQHHPVFRPVSSEFYSVVMARLENDAKYGLKIADTILQNWIDEVKIDKDIGGGKTSFEKLSELLNFGEPERKIICQKCHTIYIYDVKTQNVCPNYFCQNNPTYYQDSELGPYKPYSAKLKNPNKVNVREQEPSDLNPNGKMNLKKLYEELKIKHWEGFSCFPFYGDGLPGITFERMKSENVYCIEHSLHIPLNDSELLAKHCNKNCKLDWPFSDLYVICGESHEELLMNGTSLNHGIHFGVMDLLEEMGRYTKQAQIQAIRTKNLHTLFEMNYIFLKGSMVAIIVPFLTHCEDFKIKPSVKELYKFVSSSKNQKYQARFRYLIDVSLNCFIKRVGIRLNDEKISRGASALFFPVVFAFAHSFYRDYYHLKYLNGRFVPIQETIKPQEPDISKFLNTDNNQQLEPNLVQYDCKVRRL